MTQNDLKGFRFRESTRAPLDTAVKLRFDRFGGAVSGFSADISMEGMFVRTNDPKPVGTLVQFEFKLEEDGELIQGLGDVVWVRTRQLAPNKPPGMGIQFRYVDPHSRELIFKIVDRFLKESKGEAPGPADAEAMRAPPAGSVPPGAIGVPAGVGAPPAMTVPPAMDPPPAMTPPPAMSPAPELTPPPDLSQPSLGSSPPSLSREEPPPLGAQPEEALPPMSQLATDPAGLSSPDPLSVSPPGGDPGGSSVLAPPPAGPGIGGSLLPSVDEPPGPAPTHSGPNNAAPSPHATELFNSDDVLGPIEAAASALPVEPYVEGPEASGFHPYSGGAAAASKDGSHRTIVWVVMLLALLVGGTAVVFNAELRGWVEAKVGALPFVGGDPAPANESAVITEAGPAEDDPLPGGDDPFVDELVSSTESTPLDSATLEGTPIDEEFLDPAPDPVEVEPAAAATPVIEEPPVSVRSVVEIQTRELDGETVVTIRGDGPIQAQGFTENLLRGPPRLLIKISGIEAPYRAQTPVNSPELRAIRTGLHPGALHIVFDLAAPEVSAFAEVRGGLLQIRFLGE